MEFITSTDLKQWAETKDCQQSLPELIEKLVTASVSSPDNIDNIRFPSGDATALHGWDGFLSCKEKIDLVPVGISLWECSANKDVKTKIDDDFQKRTADPLGYDTGNATFVFVTPRIWEDADKWRQKNNQYGWKKIVVYTAVELERWIEQRPSVGMWLAQKLKKLPSNGYSLPDTYWEKWAKGEKITLPYEILLHGREEISKQVVYTASNSKSLTLQSLTQDESIAFAIATLLTCKDADKLKSRIIIASEKNAFEDLVEHYSNLIIITSFIGNIQYYLKNGHSIIVAAHPSDKKTDIKKLPKIKKEGFVESLIKAGYSEVKARKTATDTACDINILRRKENIANKPKWAENNAFLDLLPAFLVGKWNNNNDEDKKILELLSGKKYKDYELKLRNFLNAEDSPLINIDNIWRVRSPHEAIYYAQDMINSLLDEYKNICQKLIQDDDSDIVDRLLKSDSLYFDSKQKYSSDIKEGVFQNLYLLTILDDSEDKRLCRWTEQIIEELLKNWDLTRFLSNRQYLANFAEATPKLFLNFVEKFPEEITSEIFTSKAERFPSNIYYIELLSALEIFAWDKQYLNRVTELLLRFSKYENHSNWINKPINSLYNIYRFFAPQTEVGFEDRMQILRIKSQKYKANIYELCKIICESLSGFATFGQNSYPRQKIPPKIEHPANDFSLRHLDSIVSLMLKCCDYSEKQISDLLKLSFNIYIPKCRISIINAVSPYLAKIDNRKIIDDLRKNIREHQAHQNTEWSLSAAELKPYMELVDKFESNDIMTRNAWLFESGIVQLPFQDIDKYQEKLLEARNYVINEIVNSLGKNSLWDFIKITKYPESISKSLVSLYDSEFIDEICRKYKSNEISKSFACSYLRELCFKNVQEYQKLVKNIFESDNSLEILLLAAGYIKELAEIAANCGASVKSNYWKSVSVDYIAMKNPEEVVKELIKAKRYSSAIHVTFQHAKTIQMKDVEIARIIYDYANKETERDLQSDPYFIAKLLKNLDESENTEVINLLVIAEFLLYEQLNHLMDMQKLRLIKELTHNPERMMDFIKLAYKPDSPTSKTSLQAFNILNFGCRLTPLDENGKIDESFLPLYINELCSLAEKMGLEKETNFIIGFILGDIPLDDNFPPEYLCKIVENLDSDFVDQHIKSRLFFRRGVTSRLCNEGGDQERLLVSKLQKYKEKSELLYPRMSRILDDIIREYSDDAIQMDHRAQIYDLEN